MANLSNWTKQVSLFFYLNIYTTAYDSFYLALIITPRPSSSAATLSREMPGRCPPNLITNVAELSSQALNYCRSAVGELCSTCGPSQPPLPLLRHAHPHRHHRGDTHTLYAPRGPKAAAEPRHTTNTQNALW